VFIVEAFLRRARRCSPAGRWKCEISVHGKTMGLRVRVEDNSWEPESRLKQDLKGNFLEFLEKIKSHSKSSANDSRDELDE
jgi:hypothetical protein